MPFAVTEERSGWKDNGRLISQDGRPRHAGGNPKSRQRSRNGSSSMSLGATTRHEPGWDLFHDSPLDASTVRCKHCSMQALFDASTVRRKHRLVQTPFRGQNPTSRICVCVCHSVLFQHCRWPQYKQFEASGVGRTVNFRVFLCLF